MIFQGQFVVHINPGKKILFQSLNLPEYFLAEQRGKLVWSMFLKIILINF